MPRPSKAAQAVAAGVDVQMDRAAVARRAGLKVTSIDTYQRRGSIPPPDGMLGRSPWWWSSTIERWLADRPGVGSEPGHQRNAHQRRVHANGATH